MANLKPVDFNPFESAPNESIPKLKQVDFNPFEKQPDPTQEVINEMGTGEKFLVGAGRGLTDIGQGVKQLALQAGNKIGLVNDQTVQDYQKQTDDELRLYNKLGDQSTAAKIGRITGNVAATAPVALIPGGAAPGILTRAASAATQGGVAAGLTYTPEGQSRTENVLEGAAIGGGVGGILAAGGKALNALRGAKSTERATELAKLSDEYNVPLTVGELRGDRLLKIEQQLENVPFIGIRGDREKQANALKVAAGNVVNKYAPQTDDEVGSIIQKSLQKELKARKDEAGKLYDEVGALSEGKGPIATNNVNATVNNLLQKELQLPESVRNKAFIDEISSFANLDNLDFNSARVLRSRLGSEIRKAKKGTISGSVSDEKVAALTKLKSALEADIEGFANAQGGDLLNTYKAANQNYIERVVPFKDPSVRKATSSDFDTDTIVKSFLKPDRQKLAGKLVNNLDQEGQTAVKYAVLKSAFDNATDGKTPFSPLKFANDLDRLGKANNVVFAPQEKTQLDGFIKLARAAERAGQYAATPMTGYTPGNILVNAAGVGGAAALGGPSGVAAATAITYGLSKLLTSKLGRTLLTKASGLNDDSPELLKLLKNISPKARDIIPRASVFAEQGNDKNKQEASPEGNTP